MVYRVKSAQHNEGLILERVRSLPPAERLVSLVGTDKKLELIPLSIPFEKMNFPIGVFNRSHEEFHYLDRVLSRQASAYLMKEFAKKHQITSIAEQLRPATSMLQQLTSPDWVERAAEGYPENTLKATLLGLDNSKSVAKAAMGISLSDISEKITYQGNVRDTLLGHHVYDTLEKNQKSISEALVPQYVKIPTPKSTFPTMDNTSVKLMQEREERVRKEQRERDERQQRQAESSEALLKLHTEQIEENRRLQKEQRRDSRFTKIIAVVALIVSMLGVGFTALGIFN